jgi:adenosylhomocysteine nucleosidase
MSTLICFALKEEAAPFQKMAAGKSGISILITGIGRENAEKSIQGFLAKNSPDLVITCGFAGGLNPKLALGEVVFQTSDEKLRAKLGAAGAKYVEFFCAGRIATTVSEKKVLYDETGCDAVEMESEAIFWICYKHDVPCATVRVISDTADEDLPLDFNLLSKPDQSLDFGKLFFAIAKSPGKIGALMQLQKKTSFAAKQLADVLAKITFP